MCKIFIHINNVYETFELSNNCILRLLCYVRYPRMQLLNKCFVHIIEWIFYTLNEYFKHWSNISILTNTHFILWILQRSTCHNSTHTIANIHTFSETYIFYIVTFWHRATICPRCNEISYSLHENEIFVYYNYYLSMGLRIY